MFNNFSKPSLKPRSIRKRRYYKFNVIAKVKEYDKWRLIKWKSSSTTIKFMDSIKNKYDDIAFVNFYDYKTKQRHITWTKTKGWY